MRIHRMFLLALPAGAIVLGLGLAACQKKTETPAADAAKGRAEKLTVDVVKESERSAHFAAVTKQLELGGTLFGYVDVDGDVLKLMGGLSELLGELAKTQPAVAPFAQKDYAAIAQTLGLTDIKAIGASSVPEGDGFYR